MRGLGRCLVAAATGLFLCGPAGAEGADTYVDAEIGDDTSTMPACGPITKPCNTIHVDDTVLPTGYSGITGINLGSGKSLIADDFIGGDEAPGAEPDTLIDMGEIAVGTPAIRVSSAAGTIQG